MPDQLPIGPETIINTRHPPPAANPTLTASPDTTLGGGIQTSPLGRRAHQHPGPCRGGFRLNQLPYTDLIPVIDGGLAVEPFPSGGMRNTTWRAHVITPGRPCLQCNGQIDGGEVARDRAGLFDSATYIKVSDVTQPSRENVSLLAPSVTASMLGQFVSLVVAPGGLGVPGPLRFSLSTHTLEHMSVETLAGCTYEQAVGGSDRRAPLIKQQHPGADAARREREAKARTVRVLMGRLLQDVIEKATAAIGRVWVRS